MERLKLVTEPKLDKLALDFDTLKSQVDKNTVDIIILKQQHLEKHK